MPHWFYRQKRAYAGAVALNDIIAMGAPRDFCRNAFYNGSAEFVPYWSPKTAVINKPDGLYASFWKLKGRTDAIFVNRTEKTLEARMDSIQRSWASPLRASRTSL